MLFHPHRLGKSRFHKEQILSIEIEIDKDIEISPSKMRLVVLFKQILLSNKGVESSLSKGAVTII